MRQAKRGYDWGPGGKVHSIPLSKHKSNVKKKTDAKRLNDPAQFTRPRSLRDVYNDADAATGLRYGETDRNLATQQHQVPVWFAAHQAQLAGIAQGVQQGYQKAQADVAAQAQQTAQSDTNARNSLGATMQKDAASRGATVDPSLLANDVNAANFRNTNQAAFTNLLGAQGQANNTYFGGLQASGSAAELGQKLRIAGEQKGVAADKGNFRAQYVTDARGDERQNELAHAAFEIPTANAKLSAKVSAGNSKRTQDTSKAGRKAASRRERNTPITSGAFEGLTHGELRKLTPAAKQQRIKAYNKSKKPGKDGLTPAQRRSQAEKKTKAATRIQDVAGRWGLYADTLVTEQVSVPVSDKYPKGKKEVKRKPTASEIKQRLIKEGFSTVEIAKALKWLNKPPKYKPRPKGSPGVGPT